jgi:hypothetical protein
MHGCQASAGDEWNVNKDLRCKDHDRKHQVARDTATQNNNESIATYMKND